MNYLKKKTAFNRITKPNITNERDISTIVNICNNL